MRAAEAIDRRVSLLLAAPEIGRPARDAVGLRELVIPFGDTGYVALYRYDAAAGALYLLSFRHQREAGY